MTAIVVYLTTFFVCDNINRLQTLLTVKEKLRTEDENYH